MNPELLRCECQRGFTFVGPATVAGADMRAAGQARVASRANVDRTVANDPGFFQGDAKRVARHENHTGIRLAGGMIVMLIRRAGVDVVRAGVNRV